MFVVYVLYRFNLNSFRFKILRIHLQALDEEYLKVDAQFGGVDQRKIFTYAEKVTLHNDKRLSFTELVSKIG